MAKLTKTIDILGNTWSSRHLAKILLSRGEYQLRLWNEGKVPTNREAAAENTPKLTLVPDFLKDHMGLGFRTQVEQVLIHHRSRRREIWRDPDSTAKELDCGPEAVALLHDLIFYNSYAAQVLKGQPKLRDINYEWEKSYREGKHSNYVPLATVFASKSSIERVWDNTLQHDGAQLNFGSSDRVESIRHPSSTNGLALILSAPSGVQDDTHHVVNTKVAPDLSWGWRSFQCVVSREAAASVPRFFVWLDPESGQDFLSTGLLYDGAIQRCFSVFVPQSDDKVLIQIDRLSDLNKTTPVQRFFAGSPWHALFEQEWREIPSSGPDDGIYGPLESADTMIKKITKVPVSYLGISASGPSHHVLGPIGHQ